MKQTLLIVLLILASQPAYAQSSDLDVGPRFQKAIGLYYENGFAVTYSDKHLKPDRLYFGFSYFSSRLGTAWRSNAIKQDSYLLSAGYYWRREHVIRPFLRANIGYFSADYGSPIFDVLPSKALLLSPDFGICFQTHTPLKITTSFGYNTITSNGLNNIPGTIYPFYYQLTASWNILKSTK